MDQLVARRGPEGVLDPGVQVGERLEDAFAGQALGDRLRHGILPTNAPGSRGPHAKITIIERAKPGLNNQRRKIDVQGDRNDQDDLAGCMAPSGEYAWRLASKKDTPPTRSGTTPHLLVNTQDHPEPFIPANPGRLSS